jgi:hypothetical protein
VGFFILDEEIKMIVRRFDNGTVVSMEKTPEGFLKGIARVTRTGVFTYRNADGTLRRELRHPDEVFSRASLDSMRMIPITNLHPMDKLVSADTAKALSIGMTGENVIPDGKFVLVPIAITTQDGVSAVEAGREELSLGYETELEEKSGNYDGEEFDFIQRGIMYNHLAIVDRGRAGVDVRLNMDAADAIEVPEEEVELDANGLPYLKKKDGGPGSGPQGDGSKGGVDPSDKYGASYARQRVQSKNEKNQRENARLGLGKRNLKDSIDNDGTNNQHSTRSDSMVKVRLDNGLEYDAAPEVVVAFAAIQTKLDGLSADNKSLLTNADKLRADADTAKETNAQLQSKLDAMPAAIDAAVKTRVSLVKVANDTLGAETIAKLDGMTNSEIKKAIILSRFPSAKLDGVSEEYIQARFDSALEVKLDDSASAAQRETALPRNDGKGATTAQARRDAMILAMKERSTK